MLDPKGKATVRRVINRLHREKNDLTIIAITHDINEAMLSDEVLVLSRGKLIKKGSPKVVLRDEETLRSLRLDMPFIYRFEKSLNEIGIKAKAETIDLLVESIWASKLVTSPILIKKKQ